MPFLAPYKEEASILQEVANGNEKSLKCLFDYYFNHIYTTALTFTKSVTDAEEITQDVFLKIWMQREKLMTVNKFNDYLFIIARNHIYNHLRKKLHEHAFIDRLVNYFKETSHLPEERLLVKETEKIIDDAVKQLPKQQQLVFCMSRQQGLSQDEIARKLHISKNTVKSHMRQAIQSVRGYLQTQDIAYMLIATHFILSTTIGDAGF
ncbi:MAG: RNA polymerase sigma-70 factor [Bacteroidetes bacterium]|nr:RNA polymerase sigma-70 factor [Bacteroidota bacterium]MBS1609040.1 RNA polymerase sigma-70 factor [Bacteroidota bacterium]